MLEMDLLSAGQQPGQGIASGAPSPRRPVPVLVQDPWILVSGLVIVLFTALIVILLFAGRSRAGELAAAMDVATRDSARIATVLVEVASMQSRLDSLVDRVAIIRDLDSNRFVWPRLLDELARALPDEAWLVQVAQVAAEDRRTRFRVEGKTLGNQALSRFWDSIESSRFVRNVRLLSTEHLVEPVPGLSGPRTAYFFVIEGDYEGLPPRTTDSADPATGRAAP